MNKMLKVWFFEKYGEEMLFNLFQSEKEKNEFVIAHDLEIFKEEWIYV